MTGCAIVSNYRNRKGYYSFRDFDAKLGGKFRLLIEPLIGFDDRRFFYVRPLVNGKYEISGEGYIITNDESYRKRCEKFRRTIRGQSIEFVFIDESFAEIKRERCVVE